MSFFLLHNFGIKVGLARFHCVGPPPLLIINMFGSDCDQKLTYFEVYELISAYCRLVAHDCYAKHVFGVDILNRNKLFSIFLVFFSNHP